MKNKILKLITILAILTTFSCSDELEQIPHDGLTDEQLFSNTEGFENAMKAVYSGFRLGGLYGESYGLQICPEVISDNLIFNTSGRQTKKELFEWRNSAIDESFGLYEGAYKVISRANRIIDNIDKLKVEESKTKFLAEARAIRGMLHFDIARTYCKIPTQSSNANSALGIYYNKSYSPLKKHRRVGTTVKGVYTDILEDLEYAAKNISEKSKPGRLNKSAVNAVLSRVHLYMGNWDKVIETANKVTNSITPIENFKNIWTDKYLESSVFYIIITEQDDHAIGNPYSQTGKKGVKAEFSVSYPLYKLYKDTDIRKSSTIYTNDFSGHKYNNVSKYFGNPTGKRNLTYAKYIRAEEVLLNKAEALIMKKQDAEALKTLNKLRKERYTSYTEGNETGESLKKAILLERRLELAFEGDRFYTLKRLSLDIDRENYGDWADGKGTPAVAQKLKAQDYRWELPIPQGAFDANPELTKEDQNPGY